jgi:4,5-DOPA dioxygenase extradiol
MNTNFKKHISEGNHQALIDYSKMGQAAMLAIPTPDHYIPLLYTMALQDNKDTVSFFNDRAIAGSLTMTSVMISDKAIVVPEPAKKTGADSTVLDSM